MRHSVRKRPRTSTLRRNPNCEHALNGVGRAGATPPGNGTLKSGAPKRAWERFEGGRTVSPPSLEPNGSALPNQIRQSRPSPATRVVPALPRRQSHEEIDGAIWASNCPISRSPRPLRNGALGLRRGASGACAPPANSPAAGAAIRPTRGGFAGPARKRRRSREPKPHGTVLE